MTLVHDSLGRDEAASKVEGNKVYSVLPVSQVIGGESLDAGLLSVLMM